MKDNQILYLSRQDVESLAIPMSEIIEVLMVAFQEKGEGRVEMPPKPGIHPGEDDNFIHAMPAYIPALRSAGIKWVSGFPGNNARGLPYISGLLILNDVETGFPLAVMDCGWITGVRTGAATAVAARYLARPEASTAGILGCGVQGRTNLTALVALFPLRRAHAFDTNQENAARFASEMSGELGLDVLVATTARDAVANSDLVVTAGPILKRPHATIQAGWLREGAFASLVDYDSYWTREALQQVPKICTDDLEQYRFHQEMGYFQGMPEIYAELGELVTGGKPGRESPEERTMAINLGLAMDDMAVGPLVYKRALERGLGTWVDR